MKELRVCPACGYTRGFHLAFLEGGGGGVSLRMICPNCGQSYDIGWTESDIARLNVREGPRYES